MARLGWAGVAVPTLDETGHLLGLTRERVRQLQAKLVKRLEGIWPPEMDPFRMAAQAISDNRATPSRSMGAVLQEADLLSWCMPDVGVILLFRLLHVPALTEQYQTARRQLLPSLKAVQLVARDLTRSVGLASVSWVLDDVGGGISERTLRQILASVGWVQWLDDSWYWDPRVPQGRNRLANVTTKILAACGPLELHEIRGGVDRVYRLGRFPHLPPAHALRLFYAAHPNFEISASEIVSSTVPLDADRVLDSTERRLYHILRDAPDGFLDRTGFQAAALRAGIKLNTFGVYSSYSPILDNPVVDRWVLRGCDVSPAVLEAYQKQRKHRYAANEWTEQGRLRIERETLDSNLVISVPRALQPYLAGRTFTALDTKARPVGLIRWGDAGLSWGYSPYLQRAGIEEGDVLRADFDLVGGTAELSLRRRVGGTADG